MDQAIWIALAEGLGFSENREPFAALARAVPVAGLLPLSDPEDRAAWLYGTAGLLPDPTRVRVSPRALPRVRGLWDRWWRQGAGEKTSVLSSGTWRLGSTRPVNAPPRRLAALVGFSDPAVWPALCASVRTAEAGAFLAILRSVTDPYWNRHAGWDGRILPSSSRLVGPDRAAALLFQVVAPLAELTETEVGRRMEAWPAGGDAGLLRSACVRLLGAPFPPADVRTHLAREGLLQIYKDFCRARSCRDCSLPAFLHPSHPSPAPWPHLGSSA